MNRKALFLLSYCIGLVSAFAPHPVSVAKPRTSSTGLLAHDNNKNTNGLRNAAASFVVASTILSNIAIPDANAAAVDTAPSQVLAARSGGRMGGRSSPRTRVYSSRTYVRPSRSYGFGFSPGFGYRYAPTYPSFGYGSPFYGYGSPFGSPFYSPFYGPYRYGSPGFGLGFGLGATIGSQTGRAVQEYRQDSQLDKVQAELEVAKIKEQGLEARIKQLETEGVDSPSPQQLKPFPK